MNGQMTIDGVETDTVRSAVIESGEYYCFTGMYAANAIAAGSKVGFKLWCSDAPDLFDIGYGNVYIFARTYNFIDVLLFFRTLSQFNDAFYQIALTGTIPEVTYQEGYLLGLQQRDRGVTNDYQGIGVGDHTFLSGQNDLASFAITQGDIINYFNSQPAPTLEKVLCPRYFRINTIG
jgi:hypothetical protein